MSGKWLLPALVYFMSGCAPADGQTNQPKPTPTRLIEAVDKAKGVAVTGERITGKVVQTFSGGGYTYVAVKVQSGDIVWAAGPQTMLEKGKDIDVPKGMVMNKFTSKTLKRTFDTIYFLSSLPGKRLTPSPTSQPSSQPSSQPTKPKGPISVNVKKVEGGQQIGEIYAAGDSLAGKNVYFRGKVVKYLGGILGKNWLHVQDGSGDPQRRTHDITVTTKAVVAVGDTVLIRGILSKDKDFGMGYKYAFIVDEAEVTKE